MALEGKDPDVSCDSPLRKNLRPTSPKRSTPVRLLPWKSGKSMDQGSKFGTPSYPSPLDRIRTGRMERAKQLGLDTPTNYADFESNQSFPGTARHASRFPVTPDMGDLKRCTLATLRADTQNSVSFAAGSSKGCFSYSPNVSRRSNPMGGSWVYYNFVGGGQMGLAFPTGVQNPNKAVITIDGNSGEILMANKMACKLLGANGSQLCGKRLCEFLKGGKKWYATQDSQLGSSGEMVTIAGKVTELVTNQGEVVPVSVWLHRLATANDEPRHVVVLEPVTRTVATAIFDKQGTILRTDEQMAILHGYQSNNSLEGLCITNLLPYLDLPTADGSKLSKEIRKQNTTARTCDGISFPVTVRIQLHEECEKPLYKAILWVFANISGLVTVFPDGGIHSCNNNFALTLFGYSQAQLVGKNITALIPSFYDDLEFLDAESIVLPPLDDDDDEDLMFVHPSLRRNNSCHSHGTPRPTNPMGKQIELMIEDVSQAVHSLVLDSPSRFLRNSSASEPPTRSPSADCFLGNAPAMLPSGSCHAQLNSATCGEKALSCFGYTPSDSSCRIPKVSSHCTNRTAEKESEREKLRLPIKSEDFVAKKPVEETDSSSSDTLPNSPMGDRAVSTPNDSHKRPPKFVMNRYGSLESLQSIPEGSYFGLGMHKNGSDLAIIYQIKKVELDDGHVLYCLWISRDPEELAEGGRPCCSLTFQSSLFGTSRQSVKAFEESSEPSFGEESLGEECELGEYAAHYVTLQQIGKGAFGYVKMSYRKLDKLMAVTKFIRKSDINEECWVFDSYFDKKVPLEISLLLTLKHPNIVQVMDIFENDTSFQLVMEKHGSGMDLFEMIDRDPALDEPLASYIFRQVVSAVAYLHELNIVHRDIKDENIIVDHRFRVKLIDFGSANFVAKDRLFSTFCGTTEFCSPEVLLGEKYRGPELDMWALGITLYMLMYGENAYFTLEERIAAGLDPPFSVSRSLMQLLGGMLDPDPKTRHKVKEVAEHPWTNQPVTPEKYRFEDIVCATEEEANPSVYYDPETCRDARSSPIKNPRCESTESNGKATDECYEEQDSLS